MTLSLGWRAAVLSVVVFLAFLLAWHLATRAIRATRS